jgi:hypothetical protein
MERSKDRSLRQLLHFERDLFVVHEVLFRKPAIISWQNAAQR